jgi:hypothetical protein
VTTMTTSAGVCIVRVEPQVDRLLISVITNRSLDADYYSATGERVQKYLKVNAAVAAVEEFLRSFQSRDVTDTAPDLGN